MTPDIYFADVSLLLHLHDFTDYSPAPVTVTNSSVVISSAQYKWGSTSARFQGANLSTPVSVFNPGSSNWTIETWVNWVVAGNSVICSNDTTSFGFYLDSNRWIVKINNTLVFLTDWTPTTGIWYHIAAVRNGSNISIYANGVSVASGTAIDVPTLTGSFVIGNYQPQGYGLNAYLADFRVTPGVARYTADFTVPAAEFPVYSTEYIPFDLLNKTGVLTPVGSGLVIPSGKSQRPSSIPVGNWAYNAALNR